MAQTSTNPFWPNDARTIPSTESVRHVYDPDGDYIHLNWNGLFENRHQSAKCCPPWTGIVLLRCQSRYLRCIDGYQFLSRWTGSVAAWAGIGLLLCQLLFYRENSGWNARSTTRADYICQYPHLSLSPLVRLVSPCLFPSLASSTFWLVFNWLLASSSSSCSSCFSALSRPRRWLWWSQLSVKQQISVSWFSH